MSTHSSARPSISITIEHAPVAQRPQRQADVLVIEHAAHDPSSPLSPLTSTSLSPLTPVQSMQSDDDSYDSGHTHTGSGSGDSEDKVDCEAETLQEPSPLVRIVSAPITKNEIQLRATEAVVAAIQQSAAAMKTTGKFSPTSRPSTANIPPTHRPRLPSSAFTVTKRGAEMLGPEREVKAATFLSFLADHKRGSSLTLTLPITGTPRSASENDTTASVGNSGKPLVKSPIISVHHPEMKYSWHERTLSQLSNSSLNGLGLTGLLNDSDSPTSSQSINVKSELHDSPSRSPVSPLAPSPSLEAALLSLARTPSPSISMTGSLSLAMLGQYNTATSNLSNSPLLITRPTTTPSFMGMTPPNHPHPLMPLNVMPLNVSVIPLAPTIDQYQSTHVNNFVYHSNITPAVAVPLISPALLNSDSQSSSSSINRFNCSECGKPFPSNSALAMHYLVHTGEKPFPCPHCPKKFRQKGHLASHIRKHTGEKPYTCPVVECSKKFKDKSGLNTHVRRTHDTNSMTCAASGSGQFSHAVNDMVLNHSGDDIIDSDDESAFGNRPRTADTDNSGSTGSSGFCHGKRRQRSANMIPLLSSPEKKLMIPPILSAQSPLPPSGYVSLLNRTPSALNSEEMSAQLMGMTMTTSPQSPSMAVYPSHGYSGYAGNAQQSPFTNPLQQPLFYQATTA